MEKKKIGIITYHSAYNYGSVLQAFATQTYLKKAFSDYKIDMINYRLKKQKEYYSLIRTHFGKMALLRDLLQIPIIWKRRRRSNKFEDFIQNCFDLTEECSEPCEVNKLFAEYDVIISESDQIWNKHSCELHTNEWKYIYPYVLHGYNGRKISYASSLGAMSSDEIEVLIEDIS